jgi:hypothetical protein
MHYYLCSSFISRSSFRQLSAAVSVVKLIAQPLSMRTSLDLSSDPSSRPGQVEKNQKRIKFHLTVSDCDELVVGVKSICDEDNLCCLLEPCEAATFFAITHGYCSKTKHRCLLIWLKQSVWPAVPVLVKCTCLTLPINYPITKQVLTAVHVWPFTIYSWPLTLYLVKGRLSYHENFISCDVH